MLPQRRLYLLQRRDLCRFFGGVIEYKVVFLLMLLPIRLNLLDMFVGVFIRLAKICKDLHKYLKSHGTSSGPWPQNMVTSLDRTLGDISRIMDKKVCLLTKLHSSLAN